MASIRSPRAPCADAEMLTVTVHSGIPVRIHYLETVWRRCKSATAFKRCVPSAWPQLLKKNESRYFPVLPAGKSPSLMLLLTLTFINSRSGFNSAYMT